MAAPEPPEPLERIEPVEGSPRRLHPLPRGLVELYGLLAVLFVLVPEWMAGGVMVGFGEARRGSELPLRTVAWQRLPELRLATMGMAELRQLARRERICGYAGLNRFRLTERLLQRLKRQGGEAQTL